MHYTLMIAISLSIMQLQSAEQPIVHSHFPPQTITINNHVHADNKLSLDNKVNMQQQSYNSNTSTNMQNVFNQARDQVQEYTYGVFSWIAQNKKKTAFYGIAIGYGYVWYKLLSLNYALSQNTRWSQWHQTLTLEELLTKPQQEVATNLLTAIQRQYATPEQLNDFISPLVAFVRDVDTEIAQLKQLVNLHTWIDRLRISFLFPKQSALLEQSQTNIHRLIYLKNLLMNWMSENKVARFSSGQTS